MTDMRVFLAQNMKRRREILGSSQIALSEKAGCSPTLIGKIEIMKRFPSAETPSRIAKALGVEPADLFINAEKSETIKTMASRQSQRKSRKPRRG